MKDQTWFEDEGNRQDEKPFPHNIEEQIMRLADNPNISKNWLEGEAYKAGIDVDQIRGYDDGEEPKKYSEKNQTISWSDRC